MSTQPPVFPRFVPTLTEVVEPVHLIDTDDVQSHAEALVQTLSVQMAELIDRKLSTLAEELIRSLLTEHLQNLTNKLKPELEEIVRRSLYQAHLFNAGKDKQK